jgi:O-antigen biosynthesis protein
MPRVSVIIPNYNYAHFLPERIASIRNQTIQDMEIIFLDDASTDGSIGVFQEAVRGCGLPVRVLSNPTNSGSPFVQWNRGASLARGDYLWIAEADDSCAPTFLERLCPLLEDHPRVSLAYAQSMPVDALGLPVDGQTSCLAYTNDLDAHKWTRDYIQEGVQEVLDGMLIMNTIPNVSATLIRRQAYEQVHGAPEDFRLAGDWMLYLALLRHGDVAFCSQVLNHHRKHVATVTSNTVVNLTYFRELVRVQDFLLREFPLAASHRVQLREKFRRDWRHLANGPFGRISRSNLLRLFCIALRHDPRDLRSHLGLLVATMLA